MSISPHGADPGQPRLGSLVRQVLAAGANIAAVAAHTDRSGSKPDAELMDVLAEEEIDALYWYNMAMTWILKRMKRRILARDVERFCAGYAAAGRMWYSGPM